MIPQLLADACSGGGFFLLPSWYEFLQCTNDHLPILNNINSIWLVALAVVDILIRLAALFAVGMVIYGGAMLITSQGNPETTNKARGTIISAAVGLLICALASVTVKFIGSKF